MAVDNQIWFSQRDIALSFGYIDNRPREMGAQLLVGACAQDVGPQLLTLGFLPRVDALVNRYDELAAFLQQREEMRIDGFHRLHSAPHDLAASLVNDKQCRHKK